MKTSYCTTLLLLLFVLQTTIAQDLSTFYKYQGDKNDYNEDVGFPLTTEDKNEVTIHFEPTNNEPVDLLLTMAFKEEVFEETEFYLNIGFHAPIKIDMKAGSSPKVYSENELIYTGNRSQRYGFGDIPFDMFDIVLRIEDGYVRIIPRAEMSEDGMSQRFKIDSKKISITAISPKPTFIKPEFYKDYTEGFTALARQGLEIHKKSTINSDYYETIPFGEPVFILDHLDKDYLELASGKFNLKGDLRIGYLSSRMVKVLYKDEIGYVYGGFLAPMMKIDYDDFSEYDVDFNGWNIYSVASEAVFEGERLSGWKGTIDFENEFWTSLIDDSQRGLIASILFPQFLNAENINELIVSRDNTIHNMRIEIGKNESNIRIKIKNNLMSSIGFTVLRK